MMNSMLVGATADNAETSAYEAGPLSWVQAEVDEALSRSIEALANYAANPRDATTLRHARTYVHQAAGAIQMVGLDAVVAFTDEIERQLALLEDMPAERVAAACAPVDRACRKLRIFLDEIVNGTPLVALKLFPEYETMQKARGVRASAPADLFYPDMSARAPRPREGAVAVADMTALLVRQRRAFQRGLLSWLRGQADGAAQMREAVAGIEEATVQPGLRAFWWSTGALLDAVMERGLEPGFGVKQLAARIDLQIRRLAEGTAKVADRLRREVLYYVAISAPVTPSVESVQQAFNLTGLIPSAEVLNADVVGIQPHLREGREQLATVKHTWLKYISGRAENLPKLKQTLAGVHRQSEEVGNPALVKLTSALVSRLEKVGGGSVPEAMAMEYATALLLAESAFQNYAKLSSDFPQQVDTMLARLDAAQHARVIDDRHGAPALEEMSRQAQYRLLLAQVGREIQVNLRHMEQVLDAFFRDHGKRSELASLLKDSGQVRGALRMLDLQAAEELLASCEEQISAYGNASTPITDEGLELLAESLSGLGFYVEAVEQQRGDHEKLIAPLLARRRGETARHQEESTDSVEGAVQELREKLPKLVSDLQGAPLDHALRDGLRSQLAVLRDDAELIGDGDLVGQAKAALAEIEQGLSAGPAIVALAAVPAPAAPEPSQETQRLLDSEGHGLDAELLDIFLTEAAEVLDTISEQVRILSHNASDREALRTTRRQFHTLKGSGRMVGLTDLAEIAYDVEKMHNRLLEEERPVTPAALALIRVGEEEFRGWVEQLRTNHRLHPDAERIHDAIRAVEAELPKGRDSVLKRREAARFETPSARVPVSSAAADMVAPAEARLVVETPLASAAPHATETQLAAETTQAAGQTLGAATEHTAPVPALDATVPAAPPLHVDMDVGPIDAQEEDDPFAFEEVGATPSGVATLIAEVAELFDEQADEEAEHDTPATAQQQQITADQIDDDIARHVRAVQEAAFAQHAATVQEMAFTHAAAETEAASPVQVFHPEAAPVADDANVAAHAGSASASPSLAGTSAEPDSDFPPLVLDLIHALPSAAQPTLPEDTAFPARPTEESRASKVLHEVQEPAHSAEAERAEPIAPDQEHGAARADNAEAVEEIVAAAAPQYVPHLMLIAGSGHDEPPRAAVDVIDGSDVSEQISVGDVTLPRALFDILIAEADEHLATLSHELALLEFDPGYRLSPAMIRASHTLCGIHRAGGFTLVAETAQALEQTLLALAQNDEALPESAHAVVAQTVDALVLLVARIRDRQAFTPDDAREAHDAQRALEGVRTRAAARPDERSAALLAAATVVPADEQRPTEPSAVDEAALDTPLIDDLALSPVASVFAAEHDPTVREALDPANDAPEEDDLLLEASAEAVADDTTPFEDVRDDVDEQLLPIFLEEAEELFPRAGEQLRSWRRTPEDHQHAVGLRRTLHTFKGSARMAGAMRLGELAHRMESRLVQGEQLVAGSAELFETLDADLDRIAFVLDALREGRTNVPLPWLEPAAATPAVAAPAAAAPAAQVASGGGHDKSAGVVVPMLGRAPASVDQQEESHLAPAAEATETTDQRHERAVLRVRADVVDRLVNEAGEVAIARGRVEGELRTLKSNLLELTNSVVRMRAQVREIEIQAESQIQSRLSLKPEADAHFDPLEFDRFTRFQELTRSLAEGINDVSTVQQALLRNVEDADAALLAQSRLSRDMQQQLFAIRTVPFGSLSERVYRIVRQLAKELDKRVSLDIRGSQVELDRSVLEKLVGPLEHLLRNALDHGIETRDERARASKPAIAEIVLSVRQVGNEIAIELSDDGAGLDLDRIRARAVAQGRIRGDANPTEAQLIECIFEPGFSTASRVTQVSGRGIGMDVVRSEIGALGGRVEVSTRPGQGTTFLIYLPLTLAVAQAVLVRAGERLWALPAPMVEQVQQIKEESLLELYATHRLRWQGRSYPFHYLPRLLGDTEHTPEIGRFNAVLLLRTGQGIAAVHVDEMVGNQEVVVKNIGPQLARVAGIAGATVLGSGEIVLIINPVQLAQRPDIPGYDPRVPPASDTADTTPRLPLAMVVDDSLTVRKITGRLLTREGYEVVTAKDGFEALQRVEERQPDVILLDIEMPRMDGFEFAKTLKADTRHAGIPIVMITSRTAEKHRSRARELGIDVYLGKPYQEHELLQHLRELLAVTA